MSQLRIWQVLLAAAATMIAVVVAVLFVPLPSSRSTQSPGGAFAAVVKMRLIDVLVPVMPGQGGDKPGWATIYRADGRSCGTARLLMVSFIFDLVWDLDRKPRTARIGPIATWNLDDCTVVEWDP
jgi:hypothetical protein